MRGSRPEPDCAALHLELRRPGVTLALLHVEFLAQVNDLGPSDGVRAKTVPSHDCEDDQYIGEVTGTGATAARSRVC